ncbi:MULTISPECIES: GNAT family N-acetyltransferase [unclassified Paenibacillus]|uniref:GNAT family N-acetyltransferase n=1 Tax=unclassified Paenibacillus TaxID=185978 RepID=UPI000428AA08|nr:MULTISPECIES: GNAT family N-acetyltransferase [unclassified Paenibacillus]KGP79428.1 GNAT family acetyltraansferase [Paenibacillus sp. MAEPY2]KGP87965.1 GNAT family acetyltraansferase [Paenibacillus sp. MAEPY1]
MKLNPMNQEEYANFRIRSIKDFAEEKVEAGTWAAEEAQGLAEASYDKYLPEGLNTPGAYLYNLVHEVDGNVGYIWFNVTDNRRGKDAFLLDIVVEEAYRGKGYGTETMEALEREALSLGVDRIGLHVFGHNVRASSLYRKMGYEVTDLTMYKEIKG